MASESRDEQSVTVSLPEELGDWLDEQAAAMGVDRDDIVEQLVATYRATEDLDDTIDLSETLEVDPSDLVDTDQIVDEASDEIENHVETVTERFLEERLEESVEQAVDERLDWVVEQAVDDRIDELESAFQTKIEDVRERVIQVKRETDAKAPADHHHEEFDRIEQSIEEVTEEVESLQSSVESASQSHEELTADVEDIREKLTRIAWVVNDLKDGQDGSDTQRRAVDSIKRAAAQEGIEKATCESCGESVHVGLLTTPECPHCHTTVSDVRPDGGIFRTRARLVPASQLESGGE